MGLRQMLLPYLRECAPMNEGLTADLYHYNPDAVPVPEKKQYTKTIVALVAAASIILGYSAYTITSFQPAPEPVGGTLSLNFTKAAEISNKWGNIFPSSEWYMNGQIAAQKTNKTPEFIVLDAMVVGFEYTNLTPPNTFIDANLTIPINWLAIHAVTGPWGKDTGHWEDRAFTVSLYEIRKSWPLTSVGSNTYREYVSWGAFSDTTFADRNPVDVVGGITKANNGFGDTTHGYLTFNIARAINDWKAGLWNPANGFLITMIAPWESTNVEWFNVSNLLYIGLLLQWDMQDVRLQIGVLNAIPEFSLLIPVVGAMVVIFMLRRKPYIIRIA